MILVERKYLDDIREIHYSVLTAKLVYQSSYALEAIERALEITSAEMVAVETSKTAWPTAVS